MKKQNPLLRLLAPAGPLVLWTAGVLFVTMCLDISAPLFSQVFADSIITHKHPEWETPMSLLLVLILVISMVNVFYGYYKKRAMQPKYLINQTSTLFWHALRLPVQAFGKLSPSDFIVRFNNGNITFFRLVTRLIPTLVSGIQIMIMLILILILMVLYYLPALFI